MTGCDFSRTLEIREVPSYSRLGSFWRLPVYSCAIPPCKNLLCGTIAGRGFSRKPGRNSIPLISQGLMDHGIVPEAGIDITQYARSCAINFAERSWDFSEA